MVAGKFTYTKVKHNTRHCSFSLSCELYKTQSLTIVSMCTILRTTSIVAILQVPDGEEVQWLKQLCNTYIPHDSQPWMGKYNTQREYAKRTGKFLCK